MKILVITYWSFKEPLIHAWTLPYLDMIRDAVGDECEIHLFTLEKEQMQLNAEEEKAARQELQSKGITWVKRDYHHFGWRAMRAWLGNLWMLRRYVKSNNIEVIHAFGSPASTSAHVISKWTRVPYIVDSYEPHAESMVENGSWKDGSLAYRLLSYFEKRQTRNAFATLATSEGMRDYAATTYDHVPRRFLNKPAVVDLDQFGPDQQVEGVSRSALGVEKEDILCIYAGKVGGIYLRQEIFDFFKVCSERWGDRFRVIMLSDLKEDELRDLCASAELDPATIILRFVPHAHVAAYLALADFAINPVKPVPSKRYCTSIKDGEYWATGLPVVIPANISDDSDLIKQEGIGAVMETLDRTAYEGAVTTIEELIQPGNREKIRQRIREVAAQYRGLDIARNSYHQIYAPGGLLEQRPKNFVVLIYNSFRDPLFQNLVYEYMVEQSRRHWNYQFDLITFEQRKYQLPKEERKTIQAKLTAYGIDWSPLTYHSGSFMFIKKAIDFTNAFIQVVRIRLRKKPEMTIAFANNSAAISLLMSKVLGSKLMVYSYEPHSEFLAEFGIWKRSGWRYKILSRLEDRVGKDADYILTGTEHMVKELKGKAKGSVHRAPSSVDQQKFNFDQEARDQLRQEHGITEHKVLIYAGKFGGIYYDHEIAQFCAQLKASDPNWYFVFLSPSKKDEVRSILSEGGLTEQDYHLSETRTPEEMAAWLSAADIGLTAIPPYPSQRFRSPVKVGEYLMCGLPYITCRGVSEDDQWAEEYEVGVVIDEISSASAKEAQTQIDKLLEEPKESLRLRCRTTGIAYRGRAQVDELFEVILADA
ncbi:glycosyltransferase [Sanyastnella coralliicola]|uniref:glycosyltransferase n=1 Tax=Sanyastnella coralliicola TaxID=3069118 RepID=UPI0027B98187|nr:glycosyltransferase [Longitalea sp. SCSIO 12813]